MLRGCGRSDQRGRAHEHPRRRTRVRPRRRPPLACLRVQLGGVGRFRSLVRSAARRAPRRLRRISSRNGSAVRLDLRPVRLAGATSTPTATSGIRASASAGGPTIDGRWTTLRPWGWTWIGYDPWAWPTHHYGRWGFSAGAWFWIPGRTWGPAWVSWAYAPGYVSWCPLGWNNRPVAQFGYRGGYGRYYNPWHAWTVVPHRGFGRGYVHVNVVNATADRRPHA